MLALVAWLVWRKSDWRLACAWLGCTGLAALITTAGKVAFIGYGWGWAATDFTGPSGHAMFAAAILPPLLGLAAPHGANNARRGVWLGYALAVAVAVSRVAVQSHSWSEVVLGLALGVCASAITLWWVHPLRPAGWTPHLLAPALAVWAVLTVTAAPPSRTHDGVTRLALAISGRSEPYKRWQMHRDARLARDSLGAPTTPGGGLLPATGPPRRASAAGP